MEGGTCMDLIQSPCYFCAVLGVRLCIPLYLSLWHEVVKAPAPCVLAAGNALLAPTLGGDSRMSNQFGQVAEQLLQQLASTDDDVSLALLRNGLLCMHTLAGPRARGSGLAGLPVLLQQLKHGARFAVLPRHAGRADCP